MDIAAFSYESKILPLLRYAAEWTSLGHADLDEHSLRSFRIKPAARAQYHRVAQAEAVAAEAAAPAPLADDIEVDPLLLEHWLEEVIGEDDDHVVDFDGDGPADAGPGDVDADGCEAHDDDVPNIAANELAQEGEVGVDDVGAHLPEHILLKLQGVAVDGRAELDDVLRRCVDCSANPIQDKDRRSKKKHEGF